MKLLKKDNVKPHFSIRAFLISKGYRINLDFAQPFYVLIQDRRVPVWYLSFVDRKEKYFLFIDKGYLHIYEHLSKDTNLVENLLQECIDKEVADKKY